MAKTTKLCGMILIGHGLLFFLISAVGHGEVKSYTALIPCIFGAVLFGFGALAERSSDRARMHVMHGAILVGLAGVFGGLGRGVSGGLKNGFGELAIVAQVSMGAICLVFVGMCVRSFIDARKAREASSSDELE